MIAFLTSLLAAIGRFFGFYQEEKIRKEGMAEAENQVLKNNADLNQKISDRLDDSVDDGAERFLDRMRNGQDGHH